MINRAFSVCKKLLFMLWLLVIAVLGAWIAIENPQPFALSLPLITLPELSVGVYLCMVLALGVVLGFLTSYLIVTSRLYFASRQLKKANKQVDALSARSANKPLVAESSNNRSNK